MSIDRAVKAKKKETARYRQSINKFLGDNSFIGRIRRLRDMLTQSHEVEVIKNVKR